MTGSRSGGDVESAPTATDRRASVARGLETVRTDRRSHVVALLVAAVLGLGFAWFHWFGLVLAGALVGFTAPGLRRALAYGFCFGLLVLVTFGLVVSGSIDRVVAMTPIIYLAVAAALGLPVFGSLVRGLR